MSRARLTLDGHGGGVLLLHGHTYVVTNFRRLGPHDADFDAALEPCVPDEELDALVDRIEAQVRA